MTDIKHRIVISGASRGIGFELARQYLEFGIDVDTTTEVIATCRDPENAGCLQALKESFTSTNKNHLVIQKLDVSEPDSVYDFKRLLLNQPVDLLINNAGIYGPNAPLLPVDLEQWHKVMHLDCMAPVFLSQQLFDNVKASQLKKIVSISSDMGSIALNVGGGAYLYRSAKAALNAAMYSLSLDVKQFDVTVLLVHPGHVKTELGGPNAKIAVEDSVAGIRRVIASSNIQQSGKFYNWLGEPMPW